MTVQRIRNRLVLSAVVLFCFTLAGAQTAKRPLTHKDYAGWRSIVGQKLSPDGKHLAYFLFPQEGDGEFVVRNLASGAERREPAGVRPPIPRRPESIEPVQGPAPEARGPSLAFTPDSRAVVFCTFPAEAATNAAKKENKRPEEMPKGGMVIIDLAAVGDAAVFRAANVKSFQVPEEGAGIVVYQREPPPPPAAAKPEASKKSGTTDRDQAGRKTGTGARGATGTRSDTGSDLVLRNLHDASERTFPDVVEYSLSRDGKTLAFAVGAKQKENNGVFVVDAPAVEPKELLKGKGKYSKLTWDEGQTRLAFLSDRDDSESKPPKLKLYGWRRGTAAPEEWVSVATAGFKAGFVVAGGGALSFSKDGSKVFFGCAPPAQVEETKEGETVPTPAPAATEDKVQLDLWHWKDDYVQPIQKARAAQERSRSYRAVYDVDAKRFTQLADAAMQDAQPSEDGRWAFGVDDRAYRPMVEYDGRYSDYYVVDTQRGNRTPLLQKQRGSLTWSPDGRFGLFFADGNWQTISLPGGQRVNLTGKLGVAFWNEEHDAPGPPPSHGSAGWTKDSKWVLLYDRFDVWQVAPDGSAAKNLTDGVGRKTKTQFRAVRLERDPRQRHFDPAEPLLLRAENIETRESGFYEDRIDGSSEPRRLVWAAKNFSAPARARNADALVLTASTFNEFPDLLVTDSKFRNLRKVSDANPRKAQLLWGTGELIRYRNTDGADLQAALYKPENFDPAKKYPLLVYIYERLSQGVNNFVNPQPGTSINIAYYVCNGYVVLTPDIVYTIGYPGQSALKCVLPAVQAVVDRGFIDEQAIGIQGHSWGGYQIAYMVTRTKRFRAAEAGAPVANMISAYDGIRWGPGLPRQFQYEQTQSRIGGTLWQYPTRFLENSPIFSADRVETPLLMLHNDADDAVPWYQGIEYFLALRRLGKEAYLFNYNGEPHGLRRRANQKDYTVRMQQFFDHHLKGAPAPEWMQKGVPYIDRDKEKERFEALVR